MEKQFYVYILASGIHGTLYIGVTSHLIGRIWQHKNKVAQGFTAQYSVDKLVYFEVHASAEEAIRREKRLKFWQRQWKIDLIEKTNPQWHDRYDEICGLMDPAVRPQDDILPHAPSSCAKAQDPSGSRAGTYD